MGNHTSTPTISCHLEEKAPTTLTSKSKNKNKKNAGETETIRGTIRLNVPKEDLRESFEGISIDVAGVEYVVMSSPPTTPTTATATTPPQYQLAPTNAVVRLKTSIADFSAVDDHTDDHDHSDSKNSSSTSSREYYSYPFEIKLPTNNDSIAVKKSGSPSVSSSRSVSSSSSTSSSSSSSVPPAISLRQDDSNSSEDCSDDDISLDIEPATMSPSSDRRKTVVAYQLKAFLRRKPGVRLTTDTDVKCYAE